MLAYMRLIVREAGKFGGNEWLTYDSVFRRNHEGLSTPWNFIDASLHQVYIANQQGKVAVPSRHCQDVDHLSADCAVAAVLPKTRDSAAESQPNSTQECSSTKGKCPAPCQFAPPGTMEAASFRESAPMHMCVRIVTELTRPRRARSTSTPVPQP